MRIRQQVRVIVPRASLAALLLFGGTAIAEDVQRPPHRVGRSVPLQTLPQAVRDTIRSEGGPDIATAIKRTDATGATIYESPIIDHDGLHQLLVVGDDGSVLSKLPVYRHSHHRADQGATNEP